MRLGTLENVQIIIPMAGKSQRFFDAGYKKPKSLIEFSGQPMIGHILKVFKKFTDVLLIVNEEDFSSHEITRLISNFHKNAKVVKIKQHSRGPSYSVLEASEYIDQSKKIIVHYCDVSGKWDPFNHCQITRQL